MKKSSIYLLLVIFSLTYPLRLSADYSQVLFSEKHQHKLYSDALKSNEKTVLEKPGKWDAIEYVRLIGKFNDISIKAAALASIIYYYATNENIWCGNSDQNDKLVAWLNKKESSDAEKNNYVEKFVQHLNSLVAEIEEIREKHKGWDGENVARVVENYLKENKGDIALATNDFAARRGLGVEVIVRNDFRFDELINFIENKNPFILQKTDAGNYLVGIGYLKKALKIF